MNEYVIYSTSEYKQEIQQQCLHSNYTKVSTARLEVLAVSEVGRFGDDTATPLGYSDLCPVLHVLVNHLTRFTGHREYSVKFEEESR